MESQLAVAGSLAKACGKLDPTKTLAVAVGHPNTWVHQWYYPTVEKLYA
jgi:hypothetical protein